MIDPQRDGLAPPPPFDVIECGGRCYRFTDFINAWTVEQDARMIEIVDAARLSDRLPKRERTTVGGYCERLVEAIARASGLPEVLSLFYVVTTAERAWTAKQARRNADRFTAVPGPKRYAELAIFCWLEFAERLYGENADGAAKDFEGGFLEYVGLERPDDGKHPEPVREMTAEDIDEEVRERRDRGKRWVPTLSERPPRPHWHLCRILAENQPERIESIYRTPLVWALGCLDDRLRADWEREYKDEEIPID